MRKKEERMGERCLMLRNEFSESGIAEKHFLDTSNVATENIDDVIEQIMTNNVFTFTTSF